MQSIAFIMRWLPNISYIYGFSGQYDYSVVVRKRNFNVMTHIVSLARHYLYAKLQLSMQIHLLRHFHLRIDTVPD